MFFCRRVELSLSPSIDSLQSVSATSRKRAGTVEKGPPVLEVVPIFNEIKAEKLLCEQKSKIMP